MKSDRQPLRSTLEEDRRNQDLAHGPITEKRRSEIREHMRAQMRQAQRAIDAGAYDELRGSLGMGMGMGSQDSAA